MPSPHPQGCLPIITNAGGLDTTPGAVCLADSPGRPHQEEGGLALEEDFRSVGEALATEVPLSRDAGVPTEHS